LHGLAHDIVREKPARVGLEERFSIIDEREADFIRREAVNAWLAAHPNFLDDYFEPALEESRRDWARRQQLPDMVDSLALAFIRSAKDRLLTPDALRAKLDPSTGSGQVQLPAHLPLAELGYSIYVDYQRALAYRGAVDFDDLIRYALILLQSDEEFLERLRYRYPFILEDEAQDSSQTQEKILDLLSGGRVAAGSRYAPAELLDQRRIETEGSCNWVRVGDPNQAIFETFTTASPELLRAFIRSNPHADMSESGRSQPSVIALANHLIDWVMNAHPAPEARAALSLPHIQPVPSGYAPQNPPDDPAAIRLISRKYTPEEETEAVVKSVKSYLDSLADVPDEEQPTIAILVPRNARGIEVIDALKKRGIQPVELISSTSNTRAAAGSLNYLLAYLADPQSALKLSKAYQVWRRDWRGNPSLRATEGSEAIPAAKEEIAHLPLRAVQGSSQKSLLATTSALLRKIGNAESFVAPREERDWLASLGADEPVEVLQELMAFQVNVQRWLSAVTLPIDQLILTLAQDVFTDAADLALAHKLALVLRKAANDHADWRLPELTSELAVIAKNERRFIGFSSDDAGFDPERHRGKVAVTTMHKAKGLEWDRVYLMSVNNYDFPSLQPNDRFISEKWFVRGMVSIQRRGSSSPEDVSRPAAYSTNPLNLEAEALAQLTALESTSEYDWYEEGSATQRARVDYVRERLRLFYVGITRAKRELIVTWNSGRQGDATPSLALSELMGFWENKE
jgi:DNA helicase-2/ATP-dependent DNA helicase PcrA